MMTDESRRKIQGRPAYLNSLAPDRRLLPL